MNHDKQIAEVTVPASHSFEANAALPKPSGITIWATCLALVAATFLTFWPAIGCDFVNYDDPEYFSANPYVKAGLTAESVSWAFRATQVASWYPLTWLSFMLDAQVFGSGPTGPHFTNLLLHAANAVLLFLLLHSLTGAHWRSAAVAALFALHPLRVESVAWIAERKDVLSTFFGLLTLLTYAKYATADRRRVTGEGSGVLALGARHVKPFYVLALGFFTLALSSKPMLVTLPFLMLLLDWWPLQRFTNQQPTSTIRRLIWEKTPFLLLGAVAGIMTFRVHKSSGLVMSVELLPIGARIENAFVSYARYLGKTFWPVNLAVPYPHPGGWPATLVISAIVLIAGACAIAIWQRRERPYLFVGWFWFFGMLLPVSGLIQWGIQSMADRFTYFPLNGVFIALVWGSADVMARWRLNKTIVALLAGLVLAACAARTRDQLSYWRNSEALWRHAIAVTSGNTIAFFNLGTVAGESGRLAEAMEYYRTALQYSPSYFDAHYNLAVLLASQNRNNEATEHYRAALQVKPDDTAARNNLGVALLAAGRAEDAIEQFRLILQRDPTDVRALDNLGNAHARQGQVQEAERNLREALQIRPNYEIALFDLANLLDDSNRSNEAIAFYEAALHAKPDYVAAHFNLALTLMKVGKTDEGIAHIDEILRLGSKDAEINFKVGYLLARLGRRDEAVARIQEALRLNPNYAEAKQALSALGAEMP